MTEVDKSTCKVCGEIKERIRAGKFAGPGNNAKYVDSTGACWNGRVCPQCHRNKIGEGMRKLRGSRRASLQAKSA